MTIATTGCVVDGDNPRVISELKKINNLHRRRVTTCLAPEHHGPKIAGELLWSATPTQWHVKLAEVRQGSLIVHCCSSGAAEFRLPLHHLNITAAHTPRTFTLSTGHRIPLATFQTLTEEEYWRWVRVLAVEVLRQTPLQDVRLLDIIGITRGEDRRLRRGQSEDCLHQRPAITTEEHVPERRNRDRTEFSQWLHCVKRETEEENRTKNTDFDMKNMKIRRAQKIRPKLPFADTWNKLKGHIDSRMSSYHTSMQKRSISMDNVSKTEVVNKRNECTAHNKKGPVSDESGISSGDENNNTHSDNSQSCNSTAEAIYVSVREKKKFFESLGSDAELKKAEKVLNRSSSIGHFDMGQPPPVLVKPQRASSMQDLRSNALPVKQIRRLFESESSGDLTRSSDELREYNDVSTTIPEEDVNEVEATQETAKNFVSPLERKPKESVSYANIQFCRGPSQQAKISERKIHRITPHGVEPSITARDEENMNKLMVVREDLVESPANMSTLLIQRKLQRGERKLCKLRIQISEVEETIKQIADDLQSISPSTLKRRAGLEIFAALRRRLEEETSRLERLQEETAKVISDNQRTICKMSPSASPIHTPKAQ